LDKEAGMNEDLEQLAEEMAKALEPFAKDNYVDTWTPYDKAQTALSRYREWKEKT